MEFQQYFAQEWQPIPTQSTEPEKNTACFDCSICLDFARDPVVTLCGHLYCWPCIYKWFDSQSTSNELPQCPVCKAEISEKTMVPLYGRGQSFSETEPEGKVIPPRPPACNIKALTNLFNQEQQQNRNNFSNPNPNYLDDTFSPFNLRGTAAMSLFHPTAGVFGEMIYARVFGNSQSLYTYPNSYHSVGSRSPRMRRRELRAEESLNRVTLFLFCFFLLCLLVF
ncbi:E3 ubiquitin-protein ligase rma1h1 [Phtheirospermum japonicum]|uniref:E3 ubiquitin-protein ligase RMA n=1 Tax=Phtheirospermum japonicum TaxID=374723 RepID=A0A830CBZ9_9LAMI|nr:E3 ubiquitin-protein ligase rma1h1 [Phtheirospermum japonicum]